MAAVYSSVAVRIVNEKRKTFMLAETRSAIHPLPKGRDLLADIL
jgi:hypothetical protein